MHGIGDLVNAVPEEIGGVVDVVPVPNLEVGVAIESDEVAGSDEVWVGDPRIPSINVAYENIAIV